MAENRVIARKVARVRAVVAEGVPGADRGWRLALARAARDQLKLELEVTGLGLATHSLGELLDLPAPRALIAVLDGPRDGLGLLVISPDVLAAMIEQQTIGRVTPQAAVARKPTRTDAAMVAGMIDAALSGLEQALAEETDLTWAGGFRYASFLDDPRPLGLLLDDAAYRVLRAEVSLGLGAKTGVILLALPAEGRGRAPAKLAVKVAAGPDFTEVLAETLGGAGCVLDAVLTRVSLPLSTVMGLAVGEVLALPVAALGRIVLESIDGQRLAEGRLGQNRGMRALRLSAADGVIGLGGVLSGQVTPAGPPVLQPRLQATGS